MGIFKKSNSFLQNHILYENGHAIIWIKDECLRSKNDIAKAFKLVCPSIKPDKKNYPLLLSGARNLIDTTRCHAEKFYDMALKTSDAKKWFDSMEVVFSDLMRVSEIEKYIYYSSADIRIYQLRERYQIELRHLIDKSILKNMEVQFSVLNAHKKDMDEKTLKKFQSKYRTLCGR